MPIVARSTPIFARPHINYVIRPRRLQIVGGRRYRGLADACVLGQPSTDPNCFTTPAYIRALTLAQANKEVTGGLLPQETQAQEASCYDQFMSPGNFQADAYNRCIGAQDVTSAAFDAAARAGTAFAANPYQNVVAVTPPAAASPTPPPPKPPAQSNAPQSKTVGGGAGQSNAPAATTVTPLSTTVPPFSIWDDPMKTFFTGNAFGIPNWWVTLGGGGLLAWFLFGRRKR
jgi:hypothetical protein